VKCTSIDERLAASRSHALMRAYSGRTSTVAGRAPVYAPGEHRSQGKTFFIVILAMALAGLAIAVSAMADQSVLRVQLFALTEDEANYTEGFAVGIRVQPGNDLTPEQIAALTVKMRSAMAEGVPGFVALEATLEEETETASEQALLFIARFTEQVALERVAAALTPVFQEFARTPVAVWVGKGSAVKLTEE
jgi:hypothetical protein